MTDMSASAANTPGIQDAGAWELLVGSPLMSGLGWSNKTVLAHAQLSLPDDVAAVDAVSAARALDSAGIVLRSRTDILSGMYPPAGAVFCYFQGA